MKESPFKKLLDMSDKICRDELGDYYVVSKNRMDNFIQCLADGAAEIDRLRAENAKLKAEVLEAHIKGMEAQKIAEEKENYALQDNSIFSAKGCRIVVSAIRARIKELKDAKP